MVKKSEIAQSVTPAIEQVHIAKATKEMAQRKLQEFIKEETKLVKGIFQCFETPGASQTISVKKYKDVPPFKKTMTDGQTYEIPLYVARFLNGVDVTAGALSDTSAPNPMIGTCSYGVHGFKMSSANDLRPSMDGFNQDGGVEVAVPVIGITKRVRRYGFQSLEFSRPIE